MMYCGDCEDFEFRRDHPLRARLRDLQPVSPLAAAAASMHAVMAISLSGLSAVQTHYERHRDAFIKTGDDLELERMLRQVNA